MLFQTRTLQRAALALAVAGAAVAALAWLCLRDSKIAFLPGDGRAEWLVFPSAPYPGLHPIVDMEVVFRREWVLDSLPPTARLRVRAAKHVQVKINDREVAMRPGANWKDLTEAEVAGSLHAGTNVIEARVINDNAPAALWLMLASDRTVLRSDAMWEAASMGSAWRRAALARAARLPGPGNLMAGGEGTLAAVSVVWPWWVVWGVLAMAIGWVGRRWFDRLQTPNAVVASRPPEKRRQKKSNHYTPTPAAAVTVKWLSRTTVVPLLIIAALWVVLFCHNAGQLPRAVGFDRHGHIDYVEYIQKHGKLPLPNEGWEMFQPPLYYGISAAMLSASGLTPEDTAGAIVLRLFTAFLGIAHITLVFLCLRLLFPSQIGRQWVGLVLVAFLPMQLYLSHYITNETLAATLATASIFLCLRLLRAEKVSVAGYAGLGFCLGAAMLAKTTGILLIPFIVIAVASRLRSQISSLAIQARALGAMLAVSFAVCGWYYIWIWLRFGKPFVGNWDAATGFSSWQDNGYHTAADFVRFGRSLVSPLFSGYAGFADGIYSTLWGDGLCSGAGGLGFRLPWNYNLMCAGYLLAVLPSVLILTGAAVSAWRFLQKPLAEWFVLFGLSSAVAFALVFMCLKVPASGEAKAFYGLCALVPLGFFGATGWDVLTRQRRSLQFLLGTVLLVWAMNSFASMWIRGGSASTHVYLGTVFHSDGKTDAALSEFDRAIRLDPANVPARRLLAATLNDAGRTEEALQQIERAVELDPAAAASHRVWGAILVRRGQLERALDEARRAVELGPEDLAACQLLSGCLSQMGREAEAITVNRNGLAVFPTNPDLHYALGLILARRGDLTGATNQFAYALLFRPGWVEAHLNLGQALLNLGDAPGGLRQLQEAVRRAPDSPVTLNKLAWVLATSSEEAVRNGVEAVRLAEHACAVAGRRSPMLLETLAAGYAEAGRFPEAVDAAQEAISLARTAGNKAAVDRAENLLMTFQSGRPFREPMMPPP